MKNKIKLKRISKNSYSIIVTKSKSNFRGEVLAYLGKYIYLEGRNIIIIRINKVLLSEWLLKGVAISNKLNSLLKIKN